MWSLVTVSSLITLWMSNLALAGSIVHLTHGQSFSDASGDTIYEVDWNPNATASVVIDDRVGDKDRLKVFSTSGTGFPIVVLKNGQDLVLRSLNNQDFRWYAPQEDGRIVLANYFSSNQQKIEEFELFGQTLSSVDIEARSKTALYYTQGDDKLIGTSQADTLFGCYGNDRLSGQLGDDLYILCGGTGDGELHIKETGGNDSVYLPSGSDQNYRWDFAAISPDDYTGIYLYRTDNDLIVDQAFRVEQYFRDPNYQIERIVLSDGKALDSIEIKKRTDRLRISQDGQTSLKCGNNRGCVLQAHAALREIVGGAGDDIYRLPLEGPADYVVSDAGGKDTIVLGSRENITLVAARSGNDLQILDKNGRLFRVVLRDYALGESQIETIALPGWGNPTLVKVSELVDKADRNWVGSSKADDLRGTSQNETIYGLAGDDQLEGMGGDDVLIGGSGHDTFVFDQDFGLDLVQDRGEFSSIDFTYYNDDEIDVLWRDQNLILKAPGSGQAVTIEGYLDLKYINGGRLIRSFNLDEIRFHNQKSWKESDVHDLLVRQYRDLLLKSYAVNVTECQYSEFEALVSEVSCLVGYTPSEADRFRPSHLEFKFEPMDSYSTLQFDGRTLGVGEKVKVPFTERGSSHILKIIGYDGQSKVYDFRMGWYPVAP